MAAWSLSRTLAVTVFPAAVGIIGRSANDDDHKLVSLISRGGGKGKVVNGTGGFHDDGFNLCICPAKGKVFLRRWQCCRCTESIMKASDIWRCRVRHIIIVE